MRKRWASAQEKADEKSLRERGGALEEGAVEVLRAAQVQVLQRQLLQRAGKGT